MGANDSKPIQNRPQFNRINYEIVCAKVEKYTELHRDRKINEMMKADNTLKETLSNPSPMPMQVTADATASIELLNQVKGSNIVLRNIKVQKDQSLAIEAAAKSNHGLGELEASVHTVVWATSRLNLTQIQEFNNLVRAFFDPKIFQHVEQSPQVDLELKKLFERLVASPIDVKTYLEGFAKRNNISEDKLTDLWLNMGPPPAPTSNMGPAPGMNMGPAPGTGMNMGQNNMDPFPNFNGNFDPVPVQNMPQPLQPVPNMGVNQMDANMSPTLFPNHNQTKPSSFFENNSKCPPLAGL